MVIAPCSRMGPVTDDERNGLINHSALYGKYEEEVDRESAYERLQQGVQASTEQQNTPPANGKAVAVDDGILGGLKDILFGSTGPRGVSVMVWCRAWRKARRVRSPIRLFVACWEV